MRRTFFSFFCIVFLAGMLLFSLVLCPVKAADRAQNNSSSSVVLGTSVPLTGHASYLGHSIVAGMKAYFKHVNSQGGVHGRSVELIVYDDAYNPPLMISNVQSLIVEDKVDALISLIGTPTTLAVVRKSQKYEVPLLFPFTGAVELRYPSRENVVNLRPGYRMECAASVDYFIKKGRKRVAVFYQNDAYGLNGRNGVERRLIKYDLDLVAEASFSRGVVDVDTKVLEIVEQKPDVIFLIGTADVCAAFIKRAIAIGKDDIWFSAVSFVDAGELMRTLGGIDVTVYVTEVFPSVSDISLPAVREYRQLLNRFYPDMEPGQISFEGILMQKLWFMLCGRLVRMSKGKVLSCSWKKWEL